MLTVHTVADLRKEVKAAKARGEKVSFVPTMGNLHEGHLSLVDEALKHGEFVVASIFVNPMQFGANEDLDNYPRTMEADQDGLKARGCKVLFAPTVSEMYPSGLDEETRVEVPSLGNHHCGSSRPGHFTGVSTVVSKLFHMVAPDFAIFGQKDFQQLAIIRKMTKDQCFDVEVIGVPTSREASGLARSSRNGYLSAEQKETAATVYATLKDIEAKLKAREQSFESIKTSAEARLESAGFTKDYLNFADPNTLEPAAENANEIVILIAAHLGSTRLIDNLVVQR